LLLRVEFALVDDVPREALPPCYHGALVPLDDGELSLVQAVALPLLGGHKARWRHQHLRLGDGGHVMEDEVAPRTAEVPRLRIIGACGLVHGLEDPEGQAVVGSAVDVVGR
jgi:hypothetical protein